MRTFTYYGHQNDWTVELQEVPGFAYAVSAIYDTVMDRLGHPCCYKVGPCPRGVDVCPCPRTWAGWIADHLPGDQDSDSPSIRSRFEDLQWKLLNNRLTHYDFSKTKTVLKTKITRAEAIEMDAEFVANMDDIWPPEPPPILNMNLSTATASNWTFSYNPEAERGGSALGSTG